MQRDEAARAIAFYERGLARIEDRWPGTGASRRSLSRRRPPLRERPRPVRPWFAVRAAVDRTHAGRRRRRSRRWLTSPAAPADIAARQEAVAEFAFAARSARTAVARWQPTSRPACMRPNSSAGPKHQRRSDRPWHRWIAAALTRHRRDRDRVAVRWQRRPAADRPRHPGAALPGRCNDASSARCIARRRRRATWTSSGICSSNSNATVLDSTAAIASQAIDTGDARASSRHSLAAPAGGAARLAAQLDLPDPLAALHVGHAPGVGDRSVARATRRVTSAGGSRRSASSRHCHRCLRTSSSIRAIRFPEIVDELTRQQRIRRRTSSVIRCCRRHDACATTCAWTRAIAAARRQRLEHVGQEHAASHRRHQRGARTGWRARARRVAPPVAAAQSARRCASRTRCRKDARGSTRRSRASASIADVARGPTPLLFLLDELFHGTNSHDRLVGASGVLRSLLDRGAIGLITTHDLALTAIARALAPRAVNVHFEDWFDGGRSDSTTA